VVADTVVADTVVVDTVMVDTVMVDTVVADTVMVGMVPISATEAMTFNRMGMSPSPSMANPRGTEMVHTILCRIKIQRLRGPIRVTVTRDLDRRPAFTTSNRTTPHLGR
jgi:hypothetical protein